MKPELLHSTDIDPKLWDTTVENSINGSVFSYSWYLNSLYPKWDALIDPNYTLLFPLPYEEKYGYKIISISPLHFFQGIISNRLIKPGYINELIHSLPSNYKFFNYTCNKYNIPAQSNGKRDILFKKFYEKDLIRNYDHNSEVYSEAFKSELKQIEEMKMTVTGGVQLMDTLQLHINNKALSSCQLDDEGVKKLRQVAVSCLRLGAGEIVGAYDSLNELAVSVLFVSSHNKAYPIFYAQNKIASKTRIIELIFDHFIKKHSEKNLTLCIPSNFFRCTICDDLGMITTQYPEISNFELPWYVKTIKKGI